MGDDKQFAIFWLKQIKEKYIHGGDEEFDSCRKRAIDIAIKELEKPNEIIRCKDCKHKPEFERKDNYGNWYKFPDDICPCQNGSDDYYSYCPEDDWFCADGERKEGENNA